LSSWKSFVFWLCRPVITAVCSSVFAAYLATLASCCRFSSATFSTLSAAAAAASLALDDSAITNSALLSACFAPRDISSMVLGL
jgi:hypothetical protein